MMPRFPPEWIIYVLANVIGAMPMMVVLVSIPALGMLIKLARWMGWEDDPSVTRRFL